MFHWMARLSVFLVAIVGGVGAQEAGITVHPDEIVADAIDARDVELSPFGSYVALYDSTEANTVRVFDASLQVLWRHRLNAYWAGSWDSGSVIQFSPDESRVFFPAYRSDSDIAVVETRSGRLISLLSGHDPDRYVSAIALSRDGQRLVSTNGHELFVWEARGDSFEPIVRLTDFEPTTASVEWLPDGERFALSGRLQQQRFVSVYRLTDDTIEREFHYEFSDNNISHDIYQLAISPEGNRIAAGYRDKLLIFDIESESPPEEIDEIDIGTVYSLLFTPSGREIITAHSRYLRVWNVADGAIREITTVASQRPVARDIELSADGHFLYLASAADSSALSRFAVEGIEPSPIGRVVSALGGGLSPAQRSVLSAAGATEIVASIDPARLTSKDMFETAEEYDSRRNAVTEELRSRLASLVEDRYVDRQRSIRENLHELEAPIADQGLYDIDRGRYEIPALGTQAWLSIDRDAARDLYRQWSSARILVTRVGASSAYSYSDFRLRHPVSDREYPLVFSENPFTGESLDGAERRIPVIPVGPYLAVRDLRLQGIMPSLYRSYSIQPLGTMSIENTGTGILSEVVIYASIPDLETGRRQVAVPRSIAAGRTVEAAIILPIAAAILGPAGARSATLELEISYSREGVSHSERINREMTILNRNSIQWSDDRRVGAFMTADDPELVAWGSGLVAAIDRRPTNLLTRNFLAAIQLFEALSLQGINYVVDPASAYEELSGDVYAIDYLRFPSETIASRAGDCDDLSVLYATLLETVGVRSAYITTPGHIFVAVALGIDPERARDLFADPEQLILTEDETWMPVETTLLSGGFVRAWQTAALQWHRAAGEARFFESREAWRTYPPVSVTVASPGDPPGVATVEIEVARRLAEFRGIELEPQRAAIEEERARRPAAETANRLGVLHAEFGLFDEAAAYFDEAISDTGYVPALINRANIAALFGRTEEVRSYLERASAQEPANARVLLGLAFSYWRDGEQDEARRAYNRVVELRPALADRYPLFRDAGEASGGEGVERAADASATDYFATGWE